MKKRLDESEREEWKSWLKAPHSENKDLGIWSHHFMGKRWESSGNSVRFYFGGAPKSLQMMTAAMKFKDAYSLGKKIKSYDQSRYHIEKQRQYFANKGWSSHSYDFSSGHVWMWELDCEESWSPKNWCFWTVVLEKTLESPLECKEIQPGHSENQPWDFFGRNDTKVKVQYFGQHMWGVTRWKRLWCWEGLGAGGEGEDRGWDGWMASLNRWTWVWVNSGSWW